MSTGRDAGIPDGHLGPGARARVRRLAERGHYDEGTVFAILDEGFVCHVGTLSDEGVTVLPTVYGRVGRSLYLHGAPGNHALRSGVASGQACVTVTLVDGLVLARSAFHHSVNYRSVVAFGPLSEVGGTEEKRRALAAVVDHLLPGRNADARPPSEEEMRATRVVRFDIEEASAKVRTGGPNEDPADLALAHIWAGQLPLRLTPGTPVVDTTAAVLAALPPYVSAYGRREGPASWNSPA